MKQTTNVMLIEDNPEYRSVIQLAFSKDPHINLQSQFGTAEFALVHLKEHRDDQPQVILLDLNLPKMSGLEALPLIQAVAPQAKVIALTQSCHQADVIRAIEFGAAGYLLKSSKVTEIKEGIALVTQGGASLDPSIAHFLLDRLQSRSNKENNHIHLSKREMEILSLISQGLLKKQIGQQLDISYSSVATYIRRIYEKLHVPNAAAAVAKAYKLKLFNGPEDLG